jgi:hypothetical protein
MNRIIGRYGRYELPRPNRARPSEILGDRGFGTVLHGCDLRMRREVAGKFLRDRGGEARCRFV